MRQLEWFETLEDHEAGRHYRLIIETRESLCVRHRSDWKRVYRVEARFLDLGMGYESQYYEDESQVDETKGIFDAAYWAFWLVADLIEKGYSLKNLQNRLWTIARCDVDTVQVGWEEENIVYGLEAAWENVKSIAGPDGIPEVAGNRFEDMISLLDEGCNEMLFQGEEREVVWDGDKVSFVEATQEKPDPFFIPEIGPQMELFV